MCGKIHTGLLCLLALGALLPGMVEAAESNLLKNASFMQAANPNCPDFWGGASGWRLDAHRLSDEAFIKGTRSMVLTNADGKDTRFSSGNYGWSPGQTGTSYTFSVYMKADPAGLDVTIGGSRLDTRVVKVGAGWQRYTITAPLKAESGWAGRFLTVGVALSENTRGTLHVNAPMLVRDTKAPEFALEKAAAAPSKPAVRELIGEWVMGETSSGGIIKDLSGNGNDGSIVGNAAWVDTPFGRTLRFDGSTYINVPYSPTLNNAENALSVEVLLQPDDGRPMPILIRGLGWNGYALRSNLGSYEAIFHPWNFFYARSVIPGRPAHVVLTFQRPAVKMYIDGEPVTTAALDKAISVEAGRRFMLIGAYEERDAQTGKYNISTGFRGWIRLVRIYRNALSEDDVKDLYTKALSKR